MDTYPNNNMPPPLAPIESSPAVAAALAAARDEKVVPFLRSLTEMLINNHDLISFVPGDRSNNGIRTPGRIIIHDRNRVQNEVLPFYFNHASFASLRRQLSYFSFVRLGNLGRGKSTAGAVTYINHSVFELTDILTLKRRAVGDGPTAGVRAAYMPASGAGRAIPELNDGSSRRNTETRERRMRLKLKQKQSRKSSSDLRSSNQDVASAISSGRMHACETNHESDDKYLNTTTSQTVVTSSKSLSAITLGTKSRKAHASRGGASKNKKPKKRGSTPKKRGNTSKLFKISSRKIRSRIARLLNVNHVVPFIHLPVRLFKAKYLREGAQEDRGESGSEKKKRSSSSREESGSEKKKRRSSSSKNHNTSSSDENTTTAAQPTSSISSEMEEGEGGAMSSQSDSYQQSWSETNTGSEETNTSQSVVSALLALGNRHEV